MPEDTKLPLTDTLERDYSKLGQARKRHLGGTRWRGYPFLFTAHPAHPAGGTV